MLYQMMLHTGGIPFRPAQLQVSPKAPEYFNANCNNPSLCSMLVDAHLFPSGRLKKNPNLVHWTIRARIHELKIGISDEDAMATVRLIWRCLQLEPADRATAAELLSDPWFDGVE